MYNEISVCGVQLFLMCINYYLRPRDEIYAAERNGGTFSTLLDMLPKIIEDNDEEEERGGLWDSLKLFRVAAIWNGTEIGEYLPIDTPGGPCSARSGNHR